MMENEGPPNILEGLINSSRIVIFIKQGCSFCVKVRSNLEELELPYRVYDVEEMEGGTQVRADLLMRTRQRTVPCVFINGVHVGGSSHVQDLRNDNLLLPVYNKSVAFYDFDLIVIGGGSGGIAMARDSANLEKKVALIDYVEPSPQGTTWGIGGTCVNVGCIPKKLMHQAALHGAGIKDAPKFGWILGPDVEDETPAIPMRHNWLQMVDEVQAYIKSLNWNYKTMLAQKNIVYLNGRARFKDPHTIVVVDRKGMWHTITANTFVIAVGCRPNYPFGVPGAMEYGITSDDLFSLKHSPGKTLIVGASYIALECAGFLAGLGHDVTVMVRSILLRGFDRQMAELIGTQLESHGVKFVKNSVVTGIAESINKAPDKKIYRVTALQSNGEEVVESYNTVMFAMGRTPNTKGMGLEGLKMQVHADSHKIITDEADQTSVKHIYAIGDVAHGRIELTPVAIQAAKLLTVRLYGRTNRLMDYINVPTTVFTPLEYGCCGYAEEDAVAIYGQENIEVYHNVFTPLEFALTDRDKDQSYAKLVCLKTESERVVGFHMIGPNAGEITQGFALALRLNAKFSDFIDLVGIHPTCAEVFTTLRVNKSSGKILEKSSC